MKNKWTELAATEEMESEEARKFIETAIAEMKKVIGEQNHVLCVGCGDGTELSYFRNSVGIDLNEKSLEKCREKGLIVEKMDMQEMTFKDNTFNLVFARDSFEHSTSPIQAISEMARVSKKYVVIVVPTDDWQSSGWHFIIPTLKQMISLGEKVGLMLKSYREYYLFKNIVVGQNLYIFQK